MKHKRRNGLDYRRAALAAKRNRESLARCRRYESRAAYAEKQMIKAEARLVHTHERYKVLRERIAHSAPDATFRRGDLLRAMDAIIAGRKCPVIAAARPHQMDLSQYMPIPKGRKPGEWVAVQVPTMVREAGYDSEWPAESYTIDVS